VIKKFELNINLRAYLWLHSYAKNQLSMQSSRGWRIIMIGNSFSVIKYHVGMKMMAFIWFLSCNFSFPAIFRAMSLTILSDHNADFDNYFAKILFLANCYHFY
jgi:hypothetical protein